MTDIVHVCYAKEVDKPAGVDLRTRAGREAEVLAQVKEYGGFDVFWAAAESTKRAHAIDRLIERGEIVWVKGGGYPWCRYRLKRRRRETKST